MRQKVTTTSRNDVFHSRQTPRKVFPENLKWTNNPVRNVKVSKMMFDGCRYRGLVHGFVSLLFSSLTTRLDAEIVWVVHGIHVIEVWQTNFGRIRVVFGNFETAAPVGLMLYVSFDAEKK